MSVAMKELSKNVITLTREEEMLSMKMRVHDNLGYSVLAAQRMLLRGSEADRDVFLSQWKQTLDLLNKDNESVEGEQLHRQVQERAKVLGVKIIYTGEKVWESHISELMDIILLEALSNCVRHAGASELYVKFSIEEQEWVMVLTDNGQKPEKNIKEGGGLSGILKSASEAFAGVFGPTADTEVIDEIGRPIGASDTVNGVTVTADAILFDGYNYLISYTLEKEDGSAFDCTKNPDTGLYDLYWKRSDSTIGRGVDGASGSSYFYDENPSDNAIQYVETMSYNDAVQTGGTVKITLGDLCVLNSENGEPTTIAKGAWRLKFKLEAGNSAVELPAGQSIDVNGRSATVDTIVLSPIGYHVVYTVDGEATFDTLYDENGEEVPQESGREPAGVSSTWESYSAKLLVTKTDGTVLDFSDCGGSMDPHGGKTVCTRQSTFDQILPLEDMASVTIGSLSIPIE